MTSPKKAEANKKNAARSSGPKSAEGKAKSAKNALKHGMTANSPAPVPGEPTDVFQRAFEVWLDDLKPVGIAEPTWVERACTPPLTLHPCSRSENATSAFQARHAGDLFLNAELARAEALGLKLIHEPIGRCSFPTKDPAVLKLMDARVAADPPALMRSLQSFLEGVHWLLNRWAILIYILETEGYCHYPQKFDAIRLLGPRPDDDLHDPV